MRDLADAAGLEREEPPGAGGLTAVYDGRELVFQESPWRLLTVIRLLWRYWLSWWMLRAAPARAFDKFQGLCHRLAAVQAGPTCSACCTDTCLPARPSCSLGIYALLDSGTAFERPDALLKAVGLYEYTQVGGGPGQPAGAAMRCPELWPAAGAGHAGLCCTLSIPRLRRPPQASVFEFLRESYGTDVDLVARELVGAVQRCNNGQVGGASTRG